MHKLEYEFVNNTPIFKCNYCGHCSKEIEATSFTSVKNRGCCWYFPKYTLLNIKNILNVGKENFIISLLNNKNSNISSYFIEVKGSFEEKEYDKFMRENEYTEGSFDYKLFFRKCSFVTDKGCSLDFSLRPHPCNLYLCRNIINNCDKDYSSFSRERKDYFSYCNYYNEYLKYALMDKNLDLISAPLATLEFLKTISIPNFEPSEIKSIVFNPYGDVAS
ncbi:hypothetical protein K144313037_19260 [Clostridium tetani]|uniref:YkgJ family cysteine cluster protein n=1 Tax=Clostridium tetani TaxID=1513 RepID=A0ABC8EEC4_CLOTA|nr:hypothetical protein [Clostridium tetani]RXI53772.1 hypothetical protein DP122_08080 [Clostridium tetani]RXI54703.1 hypothetical protein DP124_03490 [Clostridium tetani]RXM58389.1 hypothetical protein DP133_04165 [Clostridium tetani]RXM70421.1 hypothetical protein DP139_06970 [Clostridium tetani]BDR70514.1 hypothetical protein K144313037_19260 [Clostridium tetani]